MGPSLVPLPADKFYAVYTSKEGLLRVTANGDVPGTVVNCWLQRDQWLGGLKFSLVGYYGGINPPPSQSIEKSIEEYIALPKCRFESSSVLVETADGTWSIPIRYLGFGTTGGETTLTKQASLPDSQVNVQVLPPIRINLPGGQPGEHTAAITAALPTRSSITNSIAPIINEEFIRIWDAGINGNQVFWLITWEQIPKENPVLLEIVTSSGAGPGGSGMLDVVQGYLVYLVTLTPPEKDSK